MRRILILTPHYAPETGAAARRLTAVAEGLAQRGWNVHVITLLPHHPQNAIYDGFDGTAPCRSSENGVDVLRLRPWLVQKNSLAKRLLAETRFCLQAIAHAWRGGYDLVLASSPYMFLGPIGLAFAAMRRTRFVWDVRDLTWLYPRAAGIRTYGLDVLVERVMRWTARRCHGLTTATAGLLHYFERRPARSLVFPNGVSGEWLGRLASLPQPDLTAGHVLYAGLFGYNHALETLIEVARLAPELTLTLAGDGPEGPKLQGMVAEHGLTNVRFAGYLDQDALLEAYAGASVLVSHIRANALHRWAQPAKLWEYMATGRPVVHAGEGEAVDLLLAADAAIVVPPGDATALANALRRLLSTPTEARALGERGRKFAMTQRHRERLLDEHASFLEAVAQV